MSRAAYLEVDAPAARDSSRRPRPAPWMVAVPALVVLVVATAFMLRRVQPFVDWYYIWAWYPTLALIDAGIAARSGRYYMLTRPRFALSLLGWSAVLWFFFELVNFRVANWYYVFLPPVRSLRWLGTAVAFGTVMPAIFLAERWLNAWGLFAAAKTSGFPVSRRLLVGLVVAGVGFAALSLAWPRAFFPLIWGALTLLLEPWNYSRDPGRSLLGDLAAGRPGRLLRLLVGGMGVGFIWESYNIAARAKWIYTVPGFENFKLFEMPLLGFFGFPVFALDCFVVYQALVLARVALPVERGGSSGPAPTPRLAPRRTALAALAAVVFSLGVLWGMDRWNTDSLRPELGDLWLVEEGARARLAGSGYGDIFVLAEADPSAVAEVAAVPVEVARQWVDASRLATLRGIGVPNARLLWSAGIRSVAELAAADADRLSPRLQAMAYRARAATPPRVRVWIDAARRSAGP